MRKSLEQICTEIGVDLHQILTEYAANGTTLREAARQLGANPATVWKWAAAYGITWTSKGQQSRNRAKHLSGKRLQAIANERGVSLFQFLREMAESGKPLKQLGREYGVCYQTIMCAMARRGITRPDARGYSIDGVVSLTTDHCKRLGIKYRDVEKTSQYFGITYRKALEMLIADRGMGAAA